LLDKVVAKHGLEFDYGGAVYGSSDHMPFAARLVPSVFFFSGLHGDYHRPADTWDKIDHNAAARLLEVIADLTMELTGGATPTFVRSTGASAAGVH
jgi:hypothetical protein